MFFYIYNIEYIQYILNLDVVTQIETVFVILSKLPGIFMTRKTKTTHTHTPEAAMLYALQTTNIWTAVGKNGGKTTLQLCDAIFNTKLSE